MLVQPYETSALMSADLGNEGVSNRALELILEGVLGREVGGTSTTCDICVTVSIHSNARPRVAATPTKIGRIDQRNAVHIELCNESIPGTSERFLKGVLGREILGTSGTRDIRMAMRIYSNGGSEVKGSAFWQATASAEVSRVDQRVAIDVELCNEGSDQTFQILLERVLGRKVG